MCEDQNKTNKQTKPCTSARWNEQSDPRPEKKPCNKDINDIIGTTDKICKICIDCSPWMLPISWF